ncbi:RluA family pseudouridine synthase [Acetobacter oeni]|uniref:Pseudouridine synthase n=1 Tax=Acetobacter oeni TaxID=304077 RepID=A0A511XLM7_9PROT|nr:RluA family pseudouridine synthase [Acetobacter oeni]MBB3884295.1 23S rRNA pseudouridine1911/1915/1917 synthase [Acetobacter oeni]NHO20257.1 RluA family pseudouridine synthase [Acetobacter oeni]GBR07680.1 ribosomal RNA large subunit 23S rRNA pseudouridine synthase D [Acetobacter oeni LMG 21952]GEN63850.1 pseudouridine synthase [Acetobacter oeni]
METTHGPRILTVTEEFAGQRVDRVLALGFPDLSRSRLKVLIEAGHVTRNGTVFYEPADLARMGATFVIDIPAPVPATPAGENIPFSILYEDGDLIVLDKPAGLVVHPAPGNETGTLVNALIAHCGDSLVGIGGEKRPGIVHRLDKDTSGVMIVAKTEKAHHALSADFAARRIDRSYLALCWGVPAPVRGEYEGNIGRDRRDRKRMALVSQGGKEALTRYTVQKAFGDYAALVECRLATGRTHQIRVHFSANGHPLMGDPVYLRRIPAVARRCPTGKRDVALDFPRQALHAARLGFTHPRTGETLLFETPPPEDFRALEMQLAGA